MLILADRSQLQSCRVHELRTSQRTLLL